MAEEINQDVIVHLLADNNQLKASLNEAEQSLKGFQDTNETLSSKLQKNWFAITAGITASIIVIKQVYSAVKEWITLASKHEDAVMSLNNALTKAGASYQVMSKDLQDHALAMSQVTKFSRDAYIETEEFLTVLGTAPAFLKRATDMSANLATVMGVSMPEAAKAIALALDGNVMRLIKYGIVLDKHKIATQGASYVMGELEKHFGGRALSDAQTFSGQMAILNHEIELVKESMGDWLKQSIAWWIPIMKESINWLGNMLDKMMGINQQIERSPASKYSATTQSLINQQQGLNYIATTSGAETGDQWNKLSEGAKQAVMTLHEQHVTADKAKDSLEKLNKVLVPLIESENKLGKSSNKGNDPALTWLQTLNKEQQDFLGKQETIKDSYWADKKTFEQAVQQKILTQDQYNQWVMKEGQKVGDVDAEIIKIEVDNDKAKFEKLKANMLVAVNDGKITWKQYYDWLIKEGEKFEDSGAIQAKKWEEVFKSMASESEGALTTMFDRMMQHMDSLKDAWNALWEDLKNIMIKKVAEGLASETFTNLANMLGNDKKAALTGQKGMGVVGGAMAGAAMGNAVVPILGGVVGGILGGLGGALHLWNKGGQVGRYASGGEVDNIPAFLTEGEFVVNRQSARMFSPLLKSINGYNQGGSVSNSLTNHLGGVSITVNGASEKTNWDNIVRTQIMPGIDREMTKRGETSSLFGRRGV